MNTKAKTEKEPETTKVIEENAFLDMRLLQLHTELHEGTNLIANLETRLRNIGEATLRINGAITVLQERKVALTLTSDAPSANGEAKETTSN